MELKIFDFDKDQYLIPNFLQVRAIAHKEALQDTSWFHWKFEASPYGKSILAVAIDKDIIAGCVAMGLGMAHVNGKELKCALSYDTFVNVDYQGKGLFKKLISLAEEELKRQNVSILYNFPNTSSITGFRHMGWKYVEDVVEYRIKVLKPFRTMSFLKDLKQSFMPASPNLNLLPTSVDFDNFYSENNVVTPIWNKEYLAWRFLTHPVSEYIVDDTDDYVAIARIGFRGHLKEAQILFIESKHGETSKSIVKRAIKAVSKQSNVDIISISLSNCSHIYSKLGFTIKVPTRANFTYKILDDTTDVGRFCINAIDFHTY